MTRRPRGSPRKASPRERAAVCLWKSRSEIADMSPGDVDRRVQELQGRRTDGPELERAEHALREDPAPLEGIISSAMDAIVSVGEDGRIVLFNPAAEKMFGYAAAEVNGQPLDRFIPARSRVAHRRYIRDFAEINTTSRVTGVQRMVTGVRADGTEFPIEASISRVKIGGRKLFTAVLRDVSERRAVEEALRRSEERYRAIVETQSELICRFLPDTTLTFVNGAYCRYFGGESASLIGTSFLSLIPEEHRGAALAHVAALVKDAGSATYEHQVIAAGGEVRWQEWIDRPIVDEGGRVVEFQSVGRDTTDRKRAELALRESQEALRHSREQLRELTARLITAQEDGRRRIAADLHDDVSQRLAALHVEIEVLEQQCAGVTQPAAERFRAVRARLAQVGDDVQRLAHELHPAILEHLGLPVALQAHATEFDKREGIRVTMRQRHVPEDIPSNVALCLYRVAQEALRNVAKHAGAADAVVTLEGCGGGIGLCVADSGRGFDLGQVQSKTGLGLLSMQERVRAAQGRFRVRMKPGAGTHVHAWIPLPAEVR